MMSDDDPRIVGEAAAGARDAVEELVSSFGHRRGSNSPQRASADRRTKRFADVSRVSVASRSRRPRRYRRLMRHAPKRDASAWPDARASTPSNGGVSCGPPTTSCSGCASKNAAARASQSGSTMQSSSTNASTSPDACAMPRLRLREGLGPRSTITSYASDGNARRASDGSTGAVRSGPTGTMTEKRMGMCGVRRTGVYARRLAPGKVRMAACAPGPCRARRARARDVGGRSARRPCSRRRRR